MDLILYHGKCTDGWCAAYVASKRYPQAALLPQFFSTEPPFELVEGKDVLVVDFSWKSRADNIKLNLLAKSFRILDHHASSELLLEGLDFATFDKTRSGAGLTWDYLFGKDSMGPYGENFEERPWWVNYIEDYDIWNKALWHTDEINTYVHNTPHTIPNWDKLTSMDFLKVEEIGAGMRRQVETDVRKLVEMSNVGKGWGCTIGIVNGPYFLTSDVGHELAKKHEIGIVWSVRQDGIVTFGLRSIGDIDVSKIATKMGGGGHKHAAGFEVKDLLAAWAIIKDIKSGHEA